MHAFQLSSLDDVIKYTSVGSYPVFYLTANDSVLSADAVRENFADCCDKEQPDFFVTMMEVNWEDASLFCDHSGERIESAYAEDDA